MISESILYPLDPHRSMPNDVFETTFIKQTSIYQGILLVKIQGVLLFKMDQWRIEEASTSHLVCILSPLYVLETNFDK